MKKTHSHWTLVDVIRRDIQRDPGDGPAVSVEADCAAQDMAWMAEAVEPQRRQVQVSDAVCRETST